MKNWQRIFTGIVLGITFTMLAGIWWTRTVTKDYYKTTLDLQRKVNERDLTIRNSTRISDSLAREASLFSQYRSLGLAMTHRDEASRLLPYKIGQTVYRKTDSSRVVISDVIIGGSTNEYYMRYKITDKENHVTEIIPELLFK